MSTVTATSRRESRIRRALASQGYQLRKSRLRGGESVNDRGGYMILDAGRNRIEAGEKFDLSLADVERWASESAHA